MLRWPRWWFCNYSCQLTHDDMREIFKIEGSADMVLTQLLPYINVPLMSPQRFFLPHIRNSNHDMYYFFKIYLNNLMLIKT